MYVASSHAMHKAGMEAFVAAVRAAVTLADVAAALGAAARWLGFDHFLLAEQSGGRQRLCLSDHPTSWFDRQSAGGGPDDDPVMLAGARSIVPFWWHDLPTLITMSPEQHRRMAVAAMRGLTQGYSVPMHLPGGGLGLCSFIGGTAECRLDRLADAQYLACLAVDTVRRLTDGDSASDLSTMATPLPEPMPPMFPARTASTARAAAAGRAAAAAQAAAARTDAVLAADALIAPRLTPRQLDCVILAARGKSNWVAGQLLGLSSDTVHKYIESAKRRYGVSSRTELVVRALHDGQLSFADVLAPEDASAAACRAAAAAM